MSPGSGRRGLQITKELKEFYQVEGLDDVRVIRDRQTSECDLTYPCCGANRWLELSRQLGFLRFRNLSLSRAFVERNFPTIYLHGPSAQDDRGTKVRIAYSREREDRARARAEADWNCMMVCFTHRGL